MPRKGRNFELLVKRLETTLRNSDVQVRSPEKIRGKSGVLNDADVTIRGKFQSGTLDYLAIVQCRDRNKKSDLIWLRELDSLKRDIIDSVDALSIIAVSSSDFTKQAEKYAKENGILLRKLGKNTRKDIVDLCKHMPLRYSYSKVNYKMFKILISGCNGKKITEADYANFSGTEGKIVSASFWNKEDNKVTIDNIIESIPYKLLFPNIVKYGNRADCIWLFESANMEGLYQLKTQGQKFDINELAVQGELFIGSIDAIPQPYIYHDISKNNTISDTLIYQFEKGDVKETAYLDIHHPTKRILLNGVPFDIFNQTK